MLQKQLELLEIQEEYFKEETKKLKIKHLGSKEEIKTIKGTPLVIGKFNEIIDENYELVNNKHNWCDLLH